jgi:hypothetical protein
MDIEVAEALSLLVMRINSQLSDRVAFVRDKGSAEYPQWYRREVGKVTVAVCLDIEEKLGRTSSFSDLANWTGTM